MLSVLILLHVVVHAVHLVLDVLVLEKYWFFTFLSLGHYCVLFTL